MEKAEVLKAMAHPARIRILEELTRGVKCVSDFEDFLEMSQPSVSQHLSVLRSLKIIDYFIDGRLRCYYLVNPLIPEIIGALKKELDPLPAPACCPVTKKGTYPGERRQH
ncbi:MAG: metalloregulator ArsR/SmtB family transcription factor [Nitrospiraceae bacterium]|nr:metalloregulator ArsR/SmtB family transcription factor [Nitrospiraceae bacterium]